MGSRHPGARAQRGSPGSMHTVRANIRGVHGFRVRRLAPAPRNDDAPNMTFAKILIANRGEIACRIGRTARDLGVRTAAVFRDADADALHVRAADEAVRIGPAPARESYLHIQAILAAAQHSGPGAVHPRHGLLSQNSEFAKAGGAAGPVFIGPTPAAIQPRG